MNRQEMVAYLNGLINLMDSRTSLGGDREPALMAEFTTTWDALLKDLKGESNENRSGETGADLPPGEREGSSGDWPSTADRSEV